MLINLHLCGLSECSVDASMHCWCISLFSLLIMKMSSLFHIILQLLLKFSSVNLTVSWLFYFCRLLFLLKVLNVNIWSWSVDLGVWSWSWSPVPGAEVSVLILTPDVKVLILNLSLLIRYRWQDWTYYDYTHRYSLEPFLLNLVS